MLEDFDFAIDTSFLGMPSDDVALPTVKDPWFGYSVSGVLDA
jgi:hypothetical protein